MDIPQLKAYFTGLQTRIVAALEAFDGHAFKTDTWERPEGGGGLTRVIEGEVDHRDAFQTDAEACRVHHHEHVL